VSDEKLWDESPTSRHLIFILNGKEMWKTKTTLQPTSDLSPKHQTSEISLKTSDMMLKHQKWQH